MWVRTPVPLRDLLQMRLLSRIQPVSDLTPSMLTWMADELVQYSMPPTMPFLENYCFRCLLRFTDSQCLQASCMKSGLELALLTELGQTEIRYQELRVEKTEPPICQRSLATRARPSDAKRRKRRPAAGARLPGSSAETGSLDRTTWVCTTRSARIT